MSFHTFSFPVLVNLSVLEAPDAVQFTPESAQYILLSLVAVKVFVVERCFGPFQEDRHLVFKNIHYDCSICHLKFLQS